MSVGDVSRVIHYIEQIYLIQIDDHSRQIASHENNNNQNQYCSNSLVSLLSRAWNYEETPLSQCKKQSQTRIRSVIPDVGVELPVEGADDQEGQEHHHKEVTKQNVVATVAERRKMYDILGFFSIYN